MATTQIIRDNTEVQDQAAPIATIDILRGAVLRTLEFDADHLLLIAATHPSASTASYLYRFAKAAQDSTYAHVCSILLAGEGSKSDDTGDVAFWLDEGDYGDADKVLHALGVSANEVLFSFYFYLFFYHNSIWVKTSLGQ